MDQRADWAVIVSDTFVGMCGKGRWVRAIGWGLLAHNGGSMRKANTLEMDMAERQDELQSQRKQRQACTPSHARAKPAHRRHAYATVASGTDAAVHNVIL